MQVILSQTLKEKGISQYQLSKMTGVTAGNINNLCNNKTTYIKFTILDKICTALNCTVNDILKPDIVKGDTSE